VRNLAYVRQWLEEFESATGEKYIQRLSGILAEIE
jgi:hypothetical protein